MFDGGLGRLDEQPEHNRALKPMIRRAKSVLAIDILAQRQPVKTEENHQNPGNVNKNGPLTKTRKRAKHIRVDRTAGYRGRPFPCKSLFGKVRRMLNDAGRLVLS